MSALPSITCLVSTFGIVMELRIYPNVVQRIYFTNKKPYFLIELFFYLNIEELPEYPDDLMILVSNWLTISLIKG
jgi:hypothetical protein